MNAQIQTYLPSYVNLYFVDYRDNLCESKDLLQKSVSSNSLDSIHEKVLEWWDYPEGEYLKEIRQRWSKMEPKSYTKKLRKRFGTGSVK